MPESSVSPASLTFAVSLDAAPSEETPDQPVDTVASELPAPLPETPQQEDRSLEGVAEGSQGAEFDPESPPEQRSLKDIPVKLKSQDTHFQLVLPPEGELSCTWTELFQQIQVLLKGSDRLRESNVPVHLIAEDRLLDMRQLQAIADILKQSQLQLEQVETQRRQTAVAAATCGYSVQQVTRTDPLKSAPSQPLQLQEEPLYLQTTLRSGVEIRHKGTVIIQGDVNPGASIVADGDILIWGRLRGVAHAGAIGNPECVIMALDMEPTQVRIAGQVARAPQHSLPKPYPEVAYATPEGIRIAGAMDFQKVRQALADEQPEV
ncbi:MULTISPECIES: septum site-determining protein MinC [unclassified Roseofilum]|uniref:septum site-determining protein MinC n=1 Tax=unclassified Roseofilum TaxID=2620099 RepID=UPI000E9ACDF1|nr:MULTISPECIES: septum site-determining protein MinC [unclassified Roseofilum]MBP0008296.1 septum site-determining protein MinC [Roseofilum sp. Belize Diploria]MBP0033169.1 septum site-determining protein MinC [Roseofilum sp. Belize BBD 4]HBQ97498.1 septum site-determining protein MinC [Cyanobacteria bacterium UBA11691]